MPIRKLPLLLVNQIAAGEVIERPASVVKELVENSLDARAARIEIAVEDGGRQLIRISDNGGGIPPAELPLAIAPHATSKLCSAEQLGAIRTLGFRGEALASIGSVSRLRVSSHPKTGPGGIIEVAGEHISDVAPAAGAPGTVVEVRDLFFNTPARRKFLRGAATEFGHISDLLTRLAMVQPGVSFQLSHNGRVTFDLQVLPAQPASAGVVTSQESAATQSDRTRRCLDILGKELEEGLLAFEHHNLRDASTPLLSESNGGASQRAAIATSIWGMAGVPSLARGSAKFQYLSVNGRPVRDRNLSHAIKEAYRGLIPPDKYPLVVVFIDMDPAAVDVNVHPAKAEVRFHNPSGIHGLVLASLRQRLLGSDLTPHASIMADGGWKMAGGSGAGHLTMEADALTTESRSAFSQVGSTSDFVNYFRRLDPTQKGFAYQEVKRAMQEESLLEGREGEDEPLRDAPPMPQVQPRSILQVHQSYVVTQDEQGLLIVDQHALHERVMFEELRRRVLGSESADKPASADELASAGGSGPSGKERGLESQRLLMPVVIQADADRQASLAQWRPLLERLGIEVEPIGPQAVAIQAFASFLFDRGVEPGEFVSNLLDRIDEGELRTGDPTTEEAALHEVLDMMACKAAVKAGDRMSDEELAALLEQRDRIERSSNCPHGRPTTLRLTLGDLAKQFKRT